MSTRGLLLRPLRAPGQQDRRAERQQPSVLMFPRCQVAASLTATSAADSRRGRQESATEPPPRFGGTVSRIELTTSTNARR